MTPVEKQIRNHAMRAYHAAARLRGEADRERRANYDACMRALALREQADQAAEYAQQHAERALQFDRDAAAKDDEQKQWEALLPPAPENNTPT